MKPTQPNRLLPYWPTPEEREQFNRDGFLVIPNAISPELVEKLSQAIDRNRDDPAQGFFNRVDIFGLDDVFLELIDTPKVFAKICGFLGWNIWVNHTHFNLRPPDDPEVPYRYMWHRDGGTFSLDLQGEMPMTAIKVGFYLTDLTKPGSGCTYIIPNHLGGREMIDRLTGDSPPPPEARPLNLEAGSAVIFQQRSIHSQGSPNHTTATRKTIFIQWAFRWLFPVDVMTLGGLPARVTDPIRRQLLGLDLPRQSGCFSPRYYPEAREIPLKKWLLQDIGLVRLGEVGPATMRYLTRYLNFDLS